jgi:hypothetical protein
MKELTEDEITGEVFEFGNLAVHREGEVPQMMEFYKSVAHAAHANLAKQVKEKLNAITCLPNATDRSKAIITLMHELYQEMY